MKMATCRFFKTCLNTLKNTHTFNKKNATKLKIESKPCQKKEKEKRNNSIFKKFGNFSKEKEYSKKYIYFPSFVFFPHILVIFCTEKNYLHEVL